MTTDQDPFEDPAHGDRIVFDDVNGSLLLFTVHSVEHGIETAFGESDAVKCDVAVLDGDQKGTTFENTLIFPRVLQGALGPKVGKKVLGRLGQGEAKKGQSPPWMLDDPTDDDKKVGRAWIAKQAEIEEPF